jgi:hypothetical protein
MLLPNRLPQLVGRLVVLLQIVLQEALLSKMLHRHDRLVVETMNSLSLTLFPPL